MRPNIFLIALTNNKIFDMKIELLLIVGHQLE